MSKSGYSKINITVPYTTLSAAKANLPLKVSEDGAIFALLAQERKVINPGIYTSIPTGIRLDTPEIVETVQPSKDTPSSKYSKLALQINIHTSPYLAESKGIIVVAPTVLPPSHKSEIILICQTISDKVQTIHPGEEIALLTYTLVPRVVMKFFENSHPKDPRGSTYVI